MTDMADAVDFDPRDFRNALGCYPTGVAIVTTIRTDGKKEGLTINSFASVSLDPPMVLWSILSKAASADAFRAATHFTVNVLSDDQQDLASHFATRHEDKFANCGTNFSRGLGGAPVFEGAVATFECRNEFCSYGGDHIVFFGRVLRYLHVDREPLVFHRGRFLQS